MMGLLRFPCGVGVYTVTECLDEAVEINTGRALLHDSFICVGVNVIVQ